MKKIAEISLGIVTSVGGFLEVGSISTAVQSGAAFGFQLTWAIVLGGICLIFLIEMSGRVAALSRHTIIDAIRERFGFNFFFVLLVSMELVSFLVLASEIGGVCAALEFASGIRFQWWAPAVAATAWLVLWRGSFKVIENGASLLGLITLVFVVGAFHVHPQWTEIGKGLLPHFPRQGFLRYGFMAVSILGASISPFLFYFYSSGAIEDDWDERRLATNRLVSIVGMSFGSLISVAVLILAAMDLRPHGVQIEHYRQLPLALSTIYGRPGRLLFAAALGIACLGATLEVSLSMAYMAAQGLGWNWGQNKRPREVARFSAFYTLTLVAASAVAMIGVDPLKLTIFSMALTSATLPVAVVPFLVIMNDRTYVRGHPNSWFSNGVVLAVTALALLLAVVTIPLQFFGGS